MSSFNGLDGGSIHVDGFADFVAVDITDDSGYTAVLNLKNEDAQALALEILKVSGAPMLPVGGGGPATLNVIPADATDEDLLVALSERLAAAAHFAENLDLKNGIAYLGLGLVFQSERPDIKRVIRAMLGAPILD